MAGESLERMSTRRRGAAPLASNSAARIGPKAPVAPVRNTFCVMSSNPFIGHRGGIISIKSRMSRLHNHLTRFCPRACPGLNVVQTTDKRIEDSFGGGIVEEAG